jgi:hypothetical protein
MQMTKVALKDGGVNVTFLVPVPGRKPSEADEYVLRSKCGPSTPLVLALADLAQDVVDILEFPAEDLQRLSITGLSLTSGEDGWGATIIGKRQLLNRSGVLNVTTPHLTTDAAEERDALPLETADRIREVCAHALLFVAGEREQTVLPLGGDPTPGAQFIQAWAERLRADGATVTFSPGGDAKVAVEVGSHD